ncbi:MAG: hypothetical protein H6996_10400 [Moraxellaceae bacterium]|nr:hypothetical protein [Pseudomonadales bacterium]MCB1673592.1 hypothetical protein [Pseudomonadales bacterium]MCP5175500.1 hypothetical protein [Moraxellaceae bacterium]MCP5176452.1 hypothetical protein [Moraxellaceae bacterium]HQV22847.1 hypothetical protein [Agitococcus sp.]
MTTKAKTNNTMPEKIVLKPKALALLEKVSTELNIKPEAAIIRALELLDKVNYLDKTFFEVGDAREGSK